MNNNEMQPMEIPYKRSVTITCPCSPTPQRIVQSATGVVCAVTI